MMAAPTDPRSLPTLVDLLIWRAAAHGDRVALTHLDRGEEIADQASYAALDAQARTVAACLMAAGLRGRPVLICLPSGLDFVRALLGCLYAGAVAAPAPGPDSRRAVDRVVSMIGDFGPDAVIVPPGPLPPALEAAIPPHCLRITPAEALACAPLAAPARPAADDIAFVQYTSGSLGTPRGIVITHRNIMANEAMIAAAFGHQPGQVGVNWLPLHHDMGLCGSILQGLYVGGCCHSMSPLAFLQRPVRWLRAISRLGATTSGGPTFAFELCARQISESVLAGLDLSGWKVAFCGSEPIRPAALTGFADRLAKVGFDPVAFLPCYGMAEATLFATGQPAGRGLTIRQLATPSVSCGGPVLDGRIAVVGPDDTVLPDGASGEIAIAGPHVSPGYWDASTRSAMSDPARELYVNGQRHLRTGDIGTVIAGDLHILGRSRDLIILRGTKTHAEDVEATAIAEPGGLVLAAAAFAVTHERGEHLIVVCEGPRGDAVAQAAATIGARIGEVHGILPHRVLFVRAGAIPRSANGKIRRSACRDAYLAGRLTPAAFEATA